VTHGLTSQGTLVVNGNGTTSFSVPPYLTTDADKETAVAFVDYLKQMISEQDDIVLASNLTSLELVEAYSSAQHFVGTAKMGICGGEDAVVDVNTQVCGMENLVRILLAKCDGLINTFIFSVRRRCVHSC